MIERGFGQTRSQVSLFGTLAKLTPARAGLAICLGFSYFGIHERKGFQSGQLRT